MDNYCAIKIKSSRNWNRGLILIDILVAMSLAVLFVILITQSSANSRSIFEFAKERNRLLDIYEAHAGEFEGMRPYESRSVTVSADGWDYSTTTIDAYAHWYGNDRIQTDIRISTGESGEGKLTNSVDIMTKETSTSSIGTSNFKALHNQSLTFNSVHAYPFQNINDVVGTPLCSIDFSGKDKVGSYGFAQQFFIVNKNSSASNFNQNPQNLSPKITSIILPIDSTIPLTDFQIRNGIAYISTDSTKQYDPDLFIVNIANQSNVNIVAGINTGPGISSIALAGNRVYVAVTSRTAQLQVIRMPTIDNMIIESSYKLNLPYATATPTLGNAIFFDRDRVYLGTEKWDGREFNIIDVSNPAQPVELGGMEIGSKVNGIFVRNDIAYVATSNQKQLQIIDVHDATNPVLLYSFSSSGWERQSGNIFSFFEDSLDFGRTSGGFNIKSDHELFSWGTSTIADIQNFNTGAQTNFSILSGDFSLDNPAPNSIDIAGGVYGIIKDRSFTYIATRQSGNELQIFDNNFSTTTMKIISLPALPQKITCDNSYIYILANTAPIIYQISF